jgi:predicted nucleic acid-binding protein
VTSGFLLDSDIAIHLRDGTGNASARLAKLGATPQLSLITRIELEGGVAAVPALRGWRRAALDRLLVTMPVLPIDDAMVDAYASIVAALGYSRRQVFDRLIAATAIVNDLTLITINATDFRAIPGLSLEVWPAPAQ